MASLSNSLEWTVSFLDNEHVKIAVGKGNLQISIFLLLSDGNNLDIGGALHGSAQVKQRAVCPSTARHQNRRQPKNGEVFILSRRGDIGASG